MASIVKVERISEADLLKGLRNTRLQGHGRFLIYREAELKLESHAPDALVPAQRYLLLPTLRYITTMRAVLLQHGIDIFALRGGAWVNRDDGTRRPVIPPIVEESHEETGPVLLINDGIHRIAAAREEGEHITVVVVRNVSPAYPYYAYPWPGGWEAMDRLDELPDDYEKKRYREPTGYQQLFRQFDADDVFPGVQDVRRNTNPSHLTP